MSYPNPYNAISCIDLVYSKLFPGLPDNHSHGKSHILEVVTILCMLIEQEGLVDSGAISFAIIVAIFHEAWDLKIAQGLEARQIEVTHVLQSVIDKYLQNKNSLIHDHKFPLHVMAELIIARISWTREKNKGRSDWNVLPPLFLQIRNLVSDADKLAALGPTGVQRAILFQKEHAFEHGRGILTEQQAIEKYQVFSWQERLHEYPDFIRTKAGKAEANRRMLLMHAYHVSIGIK